MPNVLPALAAMLAVQILASLAGAAGPVLAPLAASDLGVETYMLGSYVAVIYGVGATASLLSGAFVVRYGALRISQICLFSATIGLLLAALGAIPAVLAGAAFIGIAYGPTNAASSHLLARVTPAHWMNLVFSAKQTGVPIGIGVAGLLLPPLALAFDWRVAAEVCAAACLAVGLIVQPMRRTLDADRDPRARPSLSRIFSPLRMIVSEPEIRRLAIVSFLYAGMQVCLTSFLVVYLHEHLQMGLVLAGSILTVAQVAGTLGRLLWGTIADRYIRPQHTLGGLGLAMSLGAVLTASLTPQWPTAAVFLVCFLFGVTAVAWNGVFLAEIARLAPPGRVSEASGAAMFFTYGGVMVIPSLFSVILAHTGSYAIGFLCVAALCTVGGTWILWPSDAAARTRA